MAGFSPPGDDEPTPDPTSERQAYNMVADTLVGANVRFWDNVLQAAAIGICFFIGIGIGCLLMTDRLTGGVFGGFIGLLVGLFGSGIFLMVFRAIRHAQGKHD